MDQAGEATLEVETEKLYLADWRRRIGDLYAEVREMAAEDPRAAWDRWREVRERLYREHPSSPLPIQEREQFVARYFEYDAGLRFELPLTTEGASDSEGPEAPAAPALDAVARAQPLAGALALPISVGQPLTFERVGWLDVPFASGPWRLALFWLPEYAGGLFLPFRDQTNGVETYGGGRYLLDTSKGADLGGDAARGTVVVDFNFAYQPSCAFDHRWSCPLSPPENRLPLALRAGERLR